MHESVEIRLTYVRKKLAFLSFMEIVSVKITSSEHHDAFLMEKMQLFSYA